jgi:hypothetical protein
MGDYKEALCSRDARTAWKQLAIGAAVIVVGGHGWLILQYSTPAPYTAATERIMGMFTTGCTTTWTRNFLTTRSAVSPRPSLRACSTA